MLWLLLLMVVFVREIARLILAAYQGLQLRSVLLLPIGGLFSYANPESAERANDTRIQALLAITGPIVNLVFAAVVAGLIAGSTAGVPLIAKPWVTPTHLMRSTVWLSAMLGLLHLVPAYPLDAGRILRGVMAKTRGQAQATKSASGLGQGLGMLAMIAGLALLALPNTGPAAGLSPWLIMGGFFIFIGAQLEDQGVMFQSVVETVRMKDVMLTEFATMSPSDTRWPTRCSRRFTVFRMSFPWCVARTWLVWCRSRAFCRRAAQRGQRLCAQSIMVADVPGGVSRKILMLGLMIRRIAGGRMSLVPIAQEGRIVGIVTWQNLSNSMGLLAEHRRFEREN